MIGVIAKKKTKFIERQTVFALKQAETGVKAAEVAVKMDISGAGESTVNLWDNHCERRFYTDQNISYIRNYAYFHNFRFVVHSRWDFFRNFTIVNRKE